MLGQFELTGLLGKGGMGEVYRARDTKLGRDVAIKVLPEDFAADPERLARFEREAQTLAALNHPNIATVHGFEHDAERDLHYLVMEYIDGETLNERMNFGPLALKDALPIFMDIARGLDAAHEQGIVHRDLKPDNVKISADGVVKILDFGLAKNAAAAKTTPEAPTTPGSPLAVTAEGTFLGTPSYMSPEQARGQEVDRRTDVWAFGCCLYQAITGEIPYQGDTVADTVGAILKLEPDWSKLPGDLPREIGRLLKRCLEKDRHRRPASMNDTAHVLEDIVADLREGRVGTNVAPSALTSTDPSAIRSLVVLPFENLMGDKEQDFFVAGMTETLTAELSKIRALKVISRGSAMRYRATDKSMQEIAQELGVEGLIEGSIFRAGEDVRITAQLIDGRSDAHLWSESFNGTMDGIMRLQGEVALAIAKAIRIVVTPEEKKQIKSHRPISRDVQKLLWEANYAFNQQNAQGYRDAVRLYERAAEMDPECVFAFVGLAAAYWVPSILGLVPSKEGMAKAEKAAGRALELDPESSQAQFSAGYIAMTFHHDWETAKRRFDRAIALSPNSAEAHSGLGLWHLAVLEFDLAEREEEKARELDPMSPMHANNLGLVYACTKRWSESDTQMSDAIALSPQFTLGHLNRHVFRIAGDPTPDRVHALADFTEQSGKLPFTRGALAWAYGKIGKRSKAAAIARELEEAARTRHVSPMALAQAYFASGDTDGGFNWLSKSVEAREWPALYLGASPWFIRAGLRGDPRYAALLKQLNLPEAARRKALALEQEEERDGTISWAVAPPLRGRILKWALGGVAAVLLLIIGNFAGNFVRSSPDVSDASLPAITSLAVLPLGNLMNDPAQDYFVDGMTEAITAELAKIGALKVTSRTTAMRYKGSELELPEIAAALGVDAVIEGSVFRSANEVRITAQLVEGATDGHLWADSFEGTLEDVLGFQSEVALSIADAIQVAVTPAEEARIAQSYTAVPEAYDEYLQGLKRLESRAEADLRAAIAHFERATALDPKFAAAYARMATTYTLLSLYWFEDPDIGYSNAERYGLKALELDENASEAYAALGLTAVFYSVDLAESLRHNQRAVDLDPNNALSHFWLGGSMAYRGDLERSRAAYARAIELDPENPILRIGQEGQLPLFSGEPGAAERNLRRLAEQISDHPFLLWMQWGAYMTLGDEEQVLAIAERLRAAYPDNLSYRALWGAALAGVGRVDQARETLTELTALPEDTFVAPHGLAALHFALGDEGKGYEYLAQARGDLFGIAAMRTAPLYADYRNDERYWAIVEQYDMPPLPPGHHAYAAEQERLVKKAAEALLAEQGLDGAPKIESLAVLPLENLMQDSEQDYFVDGMTEAITAELSKISSLKVISRTSARTYKETDKRLPEIAEELDVRGLVQGSVMREGDDVQIRVQLYDGPTDRQLWTGSHANTVTSVLKLQAEVALAIADEIRATIEPDERHRIAAKSDVDPKAVDAYLRGLALLRTVNEDDIKLAIEEFESAIGADDRFAAAYAGLSDAYGSLAAWEFEDPGPSRALAREYARKAIELDSASAQAHASLAGNLLFTGPDWAGAIREMELSLSLDPNNARGHHLFGAMCIWMGRNREARAEFERALALEPDSVFLRRELALLSFYEGDFARAIREFEELLQEAPEFHPSLDAYISCLVNADRNEEALAVAEKQAALRDYDVYSTDRLTVPLVRLGLLDRAKSLVDGHADANATSWLYYHAALGDVEKVLEIVRLRFEKGNPIVWLAVDPELSLLRDDDRYWEFLEEYKFPLLPADHPVYPQQLAYLARKEAKRMLAEQGLDAPKMESIAVLPLRDLSAGEEDYFAQSMTEAITGELAKIKALEVRGSTSAMQYADTNLTIPEIAAALNVDALIEGSVTREEDNVGIDITLRHGATDTQISSFTDRRTITSVLQLRSEVALAIAEAVNAEITGDERDRITTTREVDPRAHDEYVLGKYFAADVTEDGQLRAIQHFEEATRRDPDFAEAWVELGSAQTTIPGFGLGSAREYLPAARESYQRALVADPDHAEALSGLAWVSMAYDYDWARAEEQFLEALDLSPNSAQVLTEYGWLLMVVGREAEAARLAGRAVEIEPEDRWIVRPSATILEQTGQPARARDAMEALLAEDPDFVPAIESLTTAYLALGMTAEAIAAAERLAEVSKRNSYSLIWLINVLATVGETDRAEAVMNELLARDDFVQDAALGRAYVCLGRLDDAFAALERGFEERDWILAWLRTAPYRPYWKDHAGFRQLLEDDRYWALMERMNFPPLPSNHPGNAVDQERRIKQAAAKMLREQQAAGEIPIGALAVLPLRNLSPRGDQDYFAESMTEAITAELAKIKALNIRGRTSAMQYKDTDLGIPEIAKALNVEALIEGSVQREGDEVKVSVTLQHGATDTQLWTFDDTQTITSVLKLQSEIALAIAEAVNTEVTGEERERIATSRDVDPRAHEAYVLGERLFQSQNETDLLTAIRFFEDATRIDPDFVEAWVKLGSSYFELWGWTYQPADQTIPKGRAAFEMALSIDSTSPGAYTSLADMTMGYDRNWQEAERLYKRAISLSPNFAQAHAMYAWYLVLVGRHDEAMEHASIALNIDPGDPFVVRNAEFVYTHAGQAERVVQRMNELLDARPDFLPALDTLYFAYITLGMYEEAVRVAERHVNLSSGSVYAGMRLAEALAGAGREDEGKKVFNQLLNQVGFSNLPAMVGSLVKFVSLDQMFEVIENAYVRGDWMLVWFRADSYAPAYFDDPDVIAFRTDDRFWELCDRMNFPPFPPDHPGYTEEQRWMVKKAAREMLAEQGMAPLIESLAVLPLDNYSNEPEQEYFVDGMTDALTAELSKVGSLKVIARTSAMRYKNTELTVREIARELGVDALIEGSVYRSGDEVRITAQLVHGDTEEHIWGESYEETIENVISLQGRMAVAIVEEVSAAVTPEEERRITVANRTSAEAYDAYLRAQHALQSRNRVAFESAIAHFETALQHDPEFAPAYAGLGQVYALQLGYGMGDRATLLGRSREASRKALAIDPDSAEAHAALGVSNSAVSTEPSNWREAEKHLLQAIRLQPGLAIAHAWLGMLYTELGRLDDGLAFLEKSVELDPLGSVPRTLLAENLVYRRQYDRAESILNAVLDDDPTSLLAVTHLQHVYSGRGYTEADIARLQSLLAGLGEDRFLGLHHFLLAARARLGQPDEARAVVAELEDGDASVQFNVPVADLWFALGAREKGFEWLQKETEAQAYWPFLRNAPGWDFLRDDRRYWELMRDFGFPPLPPEHPLYEQEQAWLIRLKAEELIRERGGLLPSETVN